MAWFPQVSATPTNAAGVMPAGATYIHYADQYQSAGKFLPNAANAAVEKPSLLRFGVGGFANAYWQKSSITVTDAYADGPSGTLSASRMVASAGSGALLQRNPTRLAAGTYTLVIEAKSNTGSNLSFSMGEVNSTVGAKTATTSYQRFTQTFTTAGGNTQIVGPYENGAGLDLLVDNIALYAGSSDLGRPIITGALWADKSGGSTDETTNPSTGVVNFSTGNGGFIRLPTAATVSSAFTAGMMFASAKVNTDANVDILCAAGPGQDQYTFSLEPAEGPVTIRARINNVIGPYGSSRFNASATGWHMLTFRYDGTTMEGFVDDVLFMSGLLDPGGAVSVRDFSLFQIISDPIYKVHSDFFYPFALTDGQIRNGLYPSIRARAIANGITLPRTVTLMHDGDSISTLGWWVTYATNISAASDLVATNYAVAGSSNIVIKARSLATYNRSYGATGGLYVHTFLAGANDLSQTNLGLSDTDAANAWLADTYSRTDPLRASGMKIGACTVLPMNNASHNSRRGVVNPLIRASSHFDFVIDVAAISNLGADADAFNTSIYPDGVHPNTASQALIESDPTYGYSKVVGDFIAAH